MKFFYAPVICNHYLTTYGEGYGIARLKCRVITFDIRILTPGRFSVTKGGAKSKVFTSILPPGGGAYSRALKAEK